jgi:hypothetical protein
VSPISSWRRDDILVCLALAISLLAYYWAPQVWLWSAAATVFTILAWYRLDLALLAVMVAAPLYRFPKAFDPALLGLARAEPLRFSVAEFAILACGLVWFLRYLVRRIARNGLGSLTWRTALSPPVALLAAATLTLPFSEHLGFSLRVYRTVILEPLLFYFLLRQTVREDAAIQRTVDAVLLLGLGVGALLWATMSSLALPRRLAASSASWPFTTRPMR